MEQNERDARLGAVRLRETSLSRPLPRVSTADRPGLPCVRTCQNRIAYRQAHRKEEAERTRRWRENHKERYAKYLEERRAKRQAERVRFLAEHRDELLARKAERLAKDIARRHRYRLEHRTQTAEYGRRYRREHATAYAQHSARRAALKRSLTTESVVRDVVFDRDGGKCHLCGKQLRREDWHLDHIIPLSRGGEHSYKNVAVSCPGCNLLKRARLSTERAAT